MTQLALTGGTPVRTKPFPAYRPIGTEEVDAAKAVIESGVLSGYLGASRLTGPLPIKLNTPFL